MRIAAFAISLGLIGPAAHADQAAETDLKTAYTYNFIVLSNWPATVGPVLRFCVAGPPAGASTFNVLGGKPARERSISVMSVASPDAAGDCQILYIPRGEVRRQGAWLAAVAQQPTLTISDQGEMPGAMVNLRVAGSQVVFDVDTRAAALANIVLSSQLIKLAATRR